MPTSRRTFLTALGSLTPAILTSASTPTPRNQDPTTPTRPIIISTWPFGKPCNEAALRTLDQGGSLLDAVEQGIHVAESDRTNSSVGLAGIPNAAGVVQLDALILHGPTHRAGSVAALEGFAHPISIARRVMEKTPHVMLAGDGARFFALEQGFNPIENHAAERYAQWRAKRAEALHTTPAQPTPGNHDTISLLVLGADGNLAAGCSTSGWGGKLPGRVGDAPIIGGGLYVDNEVGAAGATGLGENVMRHCATFLVVELMRQGLDPGAACLETLRRIAHREPPGKELSINLVALDKLGRYGSAGSASGFQFSVTTHATSQVLTAPGLGSQPIGPVGGNRK